ncbi:hypothetical protein GGX14DRAFT_401024 [Mycena pura]|uniref:Uncharacterized protein n=1 Tax=Mycena pura TaxID=153505 RepID=A0AAD6V8K8_9AGAR|nr:hypothetical protein GGX14DRAFT_401024 [Mycena pura]
MSSQRRVRVILASLPRYTSKRPGGAIGEINPPYVFVFGGGRTADGAGGVAGGVRDTVGDGRGGGRDSGRPAGRDGGGMICLTAKLVLGHSGLPVMAEQYTVHSVIGNTVVWNSRGAQCAAMKQPAHLRQGRSGTRAHCAWWQLNGIQRLNYKSEAVWTISLANSSSDLHKFIWEVCSETEASPMEYPPYGIAQGTFPMVFRMTE